MLKAIIFDFDGVIVDSVGLKSEAFSEIYSKYGNNIKNKVIKHHESNGGISRFEKFKYYHKKFLNKKITTKELEKILNQFSSLVMSKVVKAEYVEGAIDFIQDNFNDYLLFISTATPTFEINQILIKRKINFFFKEVYGSPEKKVNHIKKIMDKYNLKPGELLFIGDSVSDLDASKKMNLDFILVKNEYNVNLRKDYSGKIINNFKKFDYSKIT